jgi:hypothetical protein
MHTLPCTVYRQSPSREDTTRLVFRNLGDLTLSVRPRPGFDPASTPQHSSTGREGRHGTVLRVISPSHPQCHHGVQGWPTILRARRYSHLYRDRQNIASRLPGALASSHPIKGQARTLQGDTNNRQDTSSKPSAEQSKTPITDINISSNHPCTLFSLFETWARCPLLQACNPYTSTSV